MPQCIDGSEYLATYRMPPYLNDKIDKSTIPEAEIRGKIAKNKCYYVCKSWVDHDKKEFVYVCIVNADSTAEKHVSFDDVCKEFHWKSFEFVNNLQSIKPVIDPAWEEEITQMSNRTKASRRRKA